MGAGLDLIAAFPYVKSVFEEADQALSMKLTGLMWKGQPVSHTLTPCNVTCNDHITQLLTLIPFFSVRSEADRGGSTRHPHSLHRRVDHHQSQPYSLTHATPLTLS